MDNIVNVLVTGVGAIIGYGIVESLRLSGTMCHIVGTDIYEENYGRHMCDVFIKVPPTNSPHYFDVIKDIIEKQEVAIIFPGIEQDVFFLNSHRESFNIPTVLNVRELVNLSKNKWAMYEALSEAGFKNSIPTYINLTFEEAIEKIDFPFVVKPRSSYASKGFHIIRTERDFRAVEYELSDSTLYQPLIGTDDEEFTVSVFGDGKGDIIDYLILRRYLSKAGASEKAFVIKKDDVLMESIRWLVALFKPLGPTNFQYRKDNGRPYLLEINPRISSACSIRTRFGYNEPRLCLEHYLNSESYTIAEKSEGRAIRFIADKIIYA